MIAGKGGMNLEINWFPGHMAKTLRELQQHMQQVDLVFETCDARIPESSRNPELNRLLGTKPRLLVLNKSDLADPAITKIWLEWYRSQGVTALACDSKKRSGLAALNQAAIDMNRGKTEKALARGRIFRPVRVMVAGIPNTGKSTLINTLCGRKSAMTADRPGVTKQISWIRTKGQLDLLDSPGVLWPRLGSGLQQLRLAATGAIRDDLLPLEEIAAGGLVLLARLYPELIRSRFHLDNLELPGFKLLEAAAQRRGCLMSGGRTDNLRFAALFLDELRSGAIGRISLERPSDS
ncbi:MAG TPA: ribosome biogenesis GTPase YlqF [Clostridiales bacterium]|nr:ribosome biogenesis GTPase YlqF [Clostridiales bacterium]